MSDAAFALRNPDALTCDKPCVREITDPNEDGPWGSRCTTHNRRWTAHDGCEVASRRARTAAAEQRAGEREARLRRAEASRAGLLALVDIGTEVYSLTHVNKRGEPTGGVVVAIDDSGDPATGERLRRYVTLDRFDTPLVPAFIDEDDVNRQAIGVATPAELTRLFALLAYEQAKAFARRKDGRIGRTSVDTRIADRHRWQTALLHAMGMVG